VPRRTRIIQSPDRVDHASAVSGARRGRCDRPGWRRSARLSDVHRRGL